MRERDRAEWLARAIDDLVRGEGNAPPSPAFDGDDLTALMNVARSRLSEARSSAHLGIQYEGAIWRQVLNRLERYQHGSGQEGFPFPGALDDSAEVAKDIEELQDIIGLRRQMAAEIAELAESHRENVWAEVEARITSPRRKRTLSILPSRPFRRKTGFEEPGTPARYWPRVAALAAGLAVMAVAVGPLPATGFAQHPAVQMAEFVGDLIGVKETSKAPPWAAGEPVTVQGISVTTEQAASLMALPLREPAFLPESYGLTSSLFYSQPLTSDRPGLFALVYSNGDGGTILVYQEAASGANLAVQEGSARALALGSGAPAAYFEGAWQPAGGQFLWGEHDAQTLVFEREGVRTTIRYSGPRVEEQLLIALAEGMQPAGTGNQ